MRRTVGPAIALLLLLATSCAPSEKATAEQAPSKKQEPKSASNTCGINDNFAGAFFADSFLGERKASIQQIIADCTEKLSQGQLLPVEEVKFRVDRGARYLDTKNWSKAIDDFRAAAALAPELGTLLALRGIAEFRNGSFGAAIISFDKAVGKLPLDFKERKGTLIYEGYAYLFSGLYDEAAGFISSGIAEGVDDPDPYVYLGIALALSGNLAQAEQKLAYAVDHWPSHQLALNNLGVVRIMQNRPEDAYALFSRSVKRNQFWPNTYYNRARAAELMGQNDKAAADMAEFEKASRTVKLHWTSADGIVFPMVMTRTGAGFDLAADTVQRWAQEPRLRVRLWPARKQLPDTMSRELHDWFIQQGDRPCLVPGTGERRQVVRCYTLPEDQRTPLLARP